MLKLVSVTKSEEDESFDNINTLLITSTSLMILSCVMEVLMYFIYNNKVYIVAQNAMTTHLNERNIHNTFLL